jgi:sulfite exporter TauE/SafE
MSEPQKGSNAKKPQKPEQYTALGVVFGALGVVFFITMDSWATGLPFVALGIAFFAMGVSGTRKAKEQAPPADDDSPSS